MRKMILPISTCLGIGYLPYLGGTVASLLAAIIFYMLIPTNFFISSKNKFFYLSILGIGILLSILICDEAEKIFEEKDDRRIVIDEFIGFWVAMCLFPLPPNKKLTYLIYVFIFYRIFDITKPSYIKKISKIKGGTGIVCDDIASALIANLLMRYITSL